MAVSHLTTELSPSSEAAKVAAKSAKLTCFPEYVRAGGFMIYFDEMFDWMKRSDHYFHRLPPRTDVLEVWNFAERKFPRDLCCKALLIGLEPPGGLETPGPFRIFFATRGEEVASSVLEADLEKPILEPFEMQASDLAMRDWLRDTAGESDDYIDPVHDYDYHSCPCSCSIGIPEKDLTYCTEPVDHGYWTDVQQ